MIYLTTNFILPPKEAQVGPDLSEVFTPETREYRVDMYWNRMGSGVTVPENQRDVLRAASGDLFEDVDISSGAFDYEYGSEHGTYDPGPDVSFNGTMNVRVLHHGMTDEDRFDAEGGKYVVDLVLDAIHPDDRRELEGVGMAKMTGAVLDAQPDETLIELKWE